ncbi:MAG: FAD-dependent thymidylate synthase [Chitinispirillaceae bacterium]|jgi:thymidylate synthase ThyX|nr:FAD-dependent thymidylate synthase [Chitinispirillaceae bacterium]
MRILALGITPPPGAKNNPAVTPELLASCLARYSRSNRGIDTILDSIDWNDPDKSVDAIFRFVDYGHASIAGMTGGIAVVVDNCSMFLAYKLFELSRYCDGQESSTRYIKLDKSALPRAQDIGIPDELIPEWEAFMSLSFDCYHDVYEKLDAAALENPGIVRVPDGASDKVVDRLRKNYALDRARYFIPFATRTNAAYVMTARAWAEVIRQLDSLDLPEAHACAAGLRAEIEKFVPRLIRHSMPDEASVYQARAMSGCAIGHIAASGVPTERRADEVFISVDRKTPAFLSDLPSFASAFDYKKTRYSTTGVAGKRIMVRAAWNNMAIAELRDLNRHRTGFRFSPLAPVGFYLPEGVSHEKLGLLLDKKKTVLQKLAAHPAAGPAYVYGLLLGTQVTFEHSTHLDNFIYEIELRTGMGAHFRYAEHLAAAHERLVAVMQEVGPFIKVGTAEPE